MKQHLRTLVEVKLGTTLMPPLVTRVSAVRCACVSTRETFVMGPAMAALAGNGQRTGEGRLSWPVFLLTLAAVTTSSLSALSLYQLVALRAEVEGLKSELGRRREEGREAEHAAQVSDGESPRTSSPARIRGDAW